MYHRNSYSKIYLDPFIIPPPTNNKHNTSKTTSFTKNQAYLLPEHHLKRYMLMISSFNFHLQLGEVGYNYTQYFKIHGYQKGKVI